MAKKKLGFNNWWKIFAAYIITVIIFCKSDFKAKEDLTLIVGSVISIHNTFSAYPGKDSSNFRYIKMLGYDKPFEVFLGKYKFDFSPQFQQVDRLKEGDEISLYYRKKWFPQSAPINNQVYFIDRKKEVIYIKGNHATIQLYIALNILIGISVLIIVLALKYKKDKNL